MKWTCSTLSLIPLNHPHCYRRIKLSWTCVILNVYMDTYPSHCLIRSPSHILLKQNKYACGYYDSPFVCSCFPIDISCYILNNASCALCLSASGGTTVRSFLCRVYHVAEF